MQKPKSVLQDWVCDLTMMQQGVILGGMRGADGIQKYNSTKYLLRWYRRCVLNMAFGEIRICWDPVLAGGGSYMGPSVSTSDVVSASDVTEYEYVADGRNWEPLMQPIADDFIKTLDALPHHFVQHLRHAIQIVGYKHPEPRVRQWWHTLYIRLVKDEHLFPEPEIEMDARLGDNYAEWRKRSDDAISH